MADQWYYTENRERRGPISEEQLQELASSGQLEPTDKVWKKGMEIWETASKIDSLVFPQPSEEEPPPIPPDDVAFPISPHDEPTPAVMDEPPAISPDDEPPPIPPEDQPLKVPKENPTPCPARSRKSSVPLAFSLVILMALVGIGVFFYIHNGSKQVAKSDADAETAAESQGEAASSEPPARQVTGESSLTPTNAEALTVQPVSPPQPSTLNDIGPVNLLEKIDPARDTTQGTWRFAGNTLISSDEPGCTVKIPYSPPDNYTLTAVVERKDGTRGFTLGLVVGSRTCNVQISGEHVGGHTSGIENIDHVGYKTNATAVQGDLFANAGPHAIECTVRTLPQDEVSVAVQVDGKKITEWLGASSRLSAGIDRSLRLHTYKNVFAVTKLELRPIGATAASTTENVAQTTQQPVAETPNQSAPKWRMTGEYPLIAGKWSVLENKYGAFPIVRQDGNKIVADCTYNKDGITVQWRAQGTISKEGLITTLMVHTRPEGYGHQSRTGQLASDGRTIHMHGILPSGREEDLTWKLNEPYSQ